MPMPDDYLERVYAGVLGKLIGVYLGRPFEGWSFERIQDELGDITGYVHDRFGLPLVVTDDDISGTFIFLRALEDYGSGTDLSAAQIGRTWLNYLIEGKTVLWWGGMGNSTEETAFVRLTQGIEAPRSGSMALNSRLVAEQIGAQIFIDGWAMVAPNDYQLAARLAQRAASVSHDGAAVDAAMLLAAMEAQAFVEPDLLKLLEAGLSVIPADSVIVRLIEDLCEWHAQEKDWRATRERVAFHYGYDKFGGNCHIVPNHAVVMLSLLYSEDRFDRALMIANTCGWDTDCNSGNVGCLLGIKNGLASLSAEQDWRTPVGDRLFLPSADGGRAISDAVKETYRIVNMGRSLAGESPLAPKRGARFHFELPGSVQGFREVDPYNEGRSTLENVAGHSDLGNRSLALHVGPTEAQRPYRIATATFIPPDARVMPGYGFVASPSLYPGQTLRGHVTASEDNAGQVAWRPYIGAYDSDDRIERHYGEPVVLQPGTSGSFDWYLEPRDLGPIAEVGLEVSRTAGAKSMLYLDYLTWDGTPDLVWRRPAGKGEMWERAWTSTVDVVGRHGSDAFYLSQARGTGLLIQGCRDWTDYRVKATLTPQLAKGFGIALRVQGLKRYYAVVATDDKTVRLVKMLDHPVVLQEKPFVWEFGSSHEFVVSVARNSLRVDIDNVRLFDFTDETEPLTDGSIALLCEEGFVSCPEVVVCSDDRPA